jgi:putative membrane protein
LVTKLSSDDRAKLHAACQEAEMLTSARLAVVTVPIGDHYRLYPLAYGGVAGMATMAVLATVSMLVPSLRQMSLMEAFFITAVVAGVVTFAMDHMPLRLMAVPRRDKNHRCRELAHRAFAAHILAQNDRKTGILFFVSFGERYVEVVTDRDVDRHIPQSVWDNIIRDFAAAAGQGRAGGALPAAVEACAKVLAEYYPPA